MQLQYLARSLIQVVIQAENSFTLEEGGAAVYLNAASLALLNSSLPMLGVVCAATVFKDATSGSFSPRRSDHDGSGTYAFLFTESGGSGELVYSSWEGAGLKPNEVRCDLGGDFGSFPYAHEGCCRSLWQFPPRGKRRNRSTRVSELGHSRRDVYS